MAMVQDTTTNAKTGEIITDKYSYHTAKMGKGSSVVQVYLSLNLDKTKVMKSDLNYLHNEIFQSFYEEELIKEVINTQFVCLEIDKYMNWKNHTVHILPKLSSACYTIRQMYNFSNTEKIKMNNYAYFHSIMEYA